MGTLKMTGLIYFMLFRCIESHGKISSIVMLTFNMQSYPSFFSSLGGF